jgi:hypothetical protein
MLRRTFLLFAGFSSFAFGQASPRGILVNGVSPGMLFRLLKREGDSVTPVPVYNPFRSGDRFLIEIQLPADRFVYVLTQSLPVSNSSTRPFSLVYPKEGAPEPPLSGGVTHRIPAGAVIRMNEEVGRERLVVVSAREPLPSIRQLLLQSNPGGAKAVAGEGSNWLHDQSAATAWTGSSGGKDLDVTPHPDGWYGAARPGGLPIVIDVILTHNAR